MPDAAGQVWHFFLHVQVFILQANSLSSSWQYADYACQGPHDCHVLFYIEQCPTMR